MPKMDGFELYIKIREKDPKVKICFLTAINFYNEYLKTNEDRCPLYHRYVKISLLYYFVNYHTLDSYFCTAIGITPDVIDFW